MLLATFHGSIALLFNKIRVVCTFRPQQEVSPTRVSCEVDVSGATFALGDRSKNAAPLDGAFGRWLALGAGVLRPAVAPL